MTRELYHISIEEAIANLMSFGIAVTEPTCTFQAIVHTISCLGFQAQNLSLAS